MNNNMQAPPRPGLGGAPEPTPGAGAVPGPEPDEICFPKAALAEGEASDTMPEDGETVTVEVTGKIRYAGENAYLDPQMVNGEKVMDAEDEGEGEGQPEETDQSMRDLAQSADQTAE